MHSLACVGAAMAAKGKSVTKSMGMDNEWDCAHKFEKQLSIFLERKKGNGCNWSWQSFFANVLYLFPKFSIPVVLAKESNKS